MSAWEGSAHQDASRAHGLAPQEDPGVRCRCMDPEHHKHWAGHKNDKRPTLAAAGVNFGIALAAAKAGAKITRHGWNGKGMWVRNFDPYLDRQFKLREEAGAEGTWLPFLIMKTVDNKLVPWLASQTDILAEDWQVLP